MKVVASRLKKVIGLVISETQSASMYGRQILNDVLISNEIVYKVRKKIKGVVLFKVDFEKAYDSVD